MFPTVRCKAAMILFLALGFFTSHCHQRRKPRHLLAISVPILADSIANTAMNHIRVCDRQLGRKYLDDLPLGGYRRRQAKKTKMRWQFLGKPTVPGEG